MKRSTNRKPVSTFEQTPREMFVSFVTRASVRRINTKMKRYLSAFLLTGGLLVSVTAVKADDDDRHHYRRYYDRDGRDYHVYNQQEDRAYRSYLQERHYEYRSFPRQRRERQIEYWRWRHQHPHIVVVTPR